MKESKAMMKKEVAFMQKKGAPKSMIKHEEAEARGMKGGGMADKMGRALVKKAGAGRAMMKMAGGGMAGRIAALLMVLPPRARPRARWSRCATAVLADGYRQAKAPS